MSKPTGPDPTGKKSIFSSRQFKRIFPLILNWQFQTIYDLWLKFGSFLRHDYPGSWLLGEALWFLVGVNFALFTHSNIWLLLGVTHIVGFAAQYMQRHMFPWAFAVTQTIHSVAAGITLGIGVRGLAFIGTYAPTGFIMGAGTVSSTGGDMKSTTGLGSRMPRGNGGVYRVIPMLIILAALVALLTMPLDSVLRTGRWLLVFFAAAGTWDAIRGSDYRLLRRLAQLALCLAVGLALIFLPQLAAMAGITLPL